MQNQEKREESGVDPQVLALVGTVAISIWCGFQIKSAASSVMDLAMDPNTYVTMVVEHQDSTKDIQSDNERLAEKVNRGQAALKSSMLVADSMIYGSVIIGAAMAWRIVKGSKSKKSKK